MLNATVNTVATCVETFFGFQLSERKKQLDLLETTDNTRLKNILDDLKICYWMIDLDFILLDINKTFIEFSGAKKEMLIGRDMRDLISTEEKEQVERMFKKLCETKKSDQFELYIYGGKQKEKIPVLFHSSINTDKTGRAVSVNLLLVDISEQKKNRDALEKEKKMLQSIIFGIRDCVSIFDAHGRFMFGNSESMLIHKMNKSALLPLDSKQKIQFEQKVDGITKQFTGKIQPIFDHKGMLFAYAETLTDITSKIRLQEKEEKLLKFQRMERLNDMQMKMIGTGKKMQKVFETILRCADVDSNILVSGETGVGKELAARAIHSQSNRKENPFISVNCGALPEALVESELFGHVKGAFTGAISDRPGLFREAQNGTLFLDEIGELTKSMQIKLLRAIQDKKVRPVGSDSSCSVDIRIICATNRELYEMTQNKAFRLDLYYRIAVIPLYIPPLRERKEDLFKLVDSFIAKHQKKDRSQAKKLNNMCQQMLHRYHWPGNIRELENAVEHAIAMCEETVITPESLPPQIAYPQILQNSQTNNDAQRLKFQSNREHRQKDEIQSIVKALEKNDGNQTAAAKELGISRVTLWRKKTMYNL